MRPEARAVFEDMVRDCGPTIYRMQSSCEMYLAQYLADFPDEQALLKAALRRGVPQAVVEHDGRAGYDDHLAAVTDRLARGAEIDPAAAAWAVEAWAAALGRPSGSVAPDADPDAGRHYPDDDPDAPRLEAAAKTAMTAIVTTGGFVGGFIGTLLVPLIMMITDLTVAMHAADFDAGKPKDDLAILLVVAVAALLVGAVGGAAALAAWLFAGGEEEPWATFSVACGTAFVMVFITGFVPFIILPAKPVVFFAAVFGATYKSAARGGNY